MPVLSKLTCKFNVIPIKIPTYFYEVRQVDIEVHIKNKHIEISMKTLKKKTLWRGASLPDIKTY